MEKVLEKFTIDDVEVGDVLLHKEIGTKCTVLEKHKDRNCVFVEDYGLVGIFAFNAFDLIKKSDKQKDLEENSLGVHVHHMPFKSIVGELNIKAHENNEASIKSVLSGIDKLLEYKESKYGNASSKDRVIVFGNKCSFGPVLDNKLNRVASGEELLKNDVVDIAGYLILTLREKGWDDFSEFMD
jgi:hypothetical protein